MLKTCWSFKSNSTYRISLRILRSTKLSSRDLQLQYKEYIFRFLVESKTERRTHRVFDQRNRYVKSVKIHNKRGTTTTILSHYTWPIDREPLYKVGNEQKTSSGRKLFCRNTVAGTGIPRSSPFHRSRIIYGRDFLCESPWYGQRPIVHSSTYFFRVINSSYVKYTRKLHASIVSRECDFVARLEKIIVRKSCNL